uniref:Uncharacterized protein n=1 Tax=Rhizophora mucronata TaxID=61149 RepID=A0A2P2Q261_RHIMU
MNQSLKGPKYFKFFLFNLQWWSVLCFQRITKDEGCGLPWHVG